MAGRILKFAADTKIYHTVYSEEDVRALQLDLCNLVEWSKEWQMLFNANKRRVIHVGYNNKLECGQMPNLMVALPNIGGAVCSTPHSLADAHYSSAVQ